jgi:hypothetical protein
MNRTHVVPLLLMLAGCPANSSVHDAGAGENPAQLWLAPNNARIAFHLVGMEPPPF